MATYSIREYYDMLRALARVDENFREAPQEYVRIVEDPDRIPREETFRALRDRVLQTGNLLPDHGNAGRRRTRIPEDLRNRILEQFRLNPNLSTRLCAVRFELNHLDIHKILKEECLHPFHFKKVQHLVGQDDYNRRLVFAVDFLEQQRLVPDYVSLILWSDECNFTPEGMFNTKNYVTWTDLNPHLVAQVRTQYKWTINVWAGIIDNKLVFHKVAC